jgi:hypothetical protein
MIIITQPNATEEQINRIVTRVREFGLDAQISRGASRVIIGVIGPEALLRENRSPPCRALKRSSRAEALQTCLARISRSSVAIGGVK